MFNLFNEPVEQVKKKTFMEKYQDYLKSAQWKRIREYKINEVGGKCEKCGVSKFSARLDAHHKTYDRFMHERMTDIEILCAECHPEKDKERKLDEIDKKMNKPLIRGFENWMDRGSDGNWRIYTDSYLSKKWDEFLHYIERVTGKEYKMKFWRSPDWYD